MERGERGVEENEGRGGGSVVSILSCLNKSTCGVHVSVVLTFVVQRRCASESCYIDNDGDVASVLRHRYVVPCDIHHLRKRSIYLYTYLYKLGVSFDVVNIVVFGGSA